MSGNPQVPVEADSADGIHAADDIQHGSGKEAVAIVGLGASAGGLDALNRFFQRIPQDSGLAFVIVQHLDPDHDSLLSEILQRNTPLTVHKVRDRMTVEADCIYVIPPNRNLSLAQDVLLLSMPEQPRGRRMPIDHFFTSLAHACNETAIAIVLSGTGTDGTLGAQAVSAQGGMVLAQAPGTAKYQGMPESVINAGYASHILPVEAMPAVLLSRKNRLKIIQTANHGFNKVLFALRNLAGHDFSQYKKQTMCRRIERRMQTHNIDDPRVYARLIHENQAERNTLFKELLINVTSFFRDPEAFDTLENRILPQLLADRPASQDLRIWVAGCASGEEAYSIAILLREYMTRTHTRYKVQLYATDLDDEAIEQARNGLYPHSITSDISPARLHDFFVEEPTGYRIKPHIREMVVFATHNVINDPPFVRLDLLCCRNLLIYLEPSLQNQMMQRFYFALQPGGMLFLSPSEGVGNQGELFTLIDCKWKFYRANPRSKPSRKRLFNGQVLKTPDPMPDPEAQMNPPAPVNYSELTKNILLQTFAPASVVTDTRGEILFVHGDTGRYLRPAPGRPSLNVIDMAHEGLQMPLRAAIDTAVTDRVEIRNQAMDMFAQGSKEQHSFSVRLMSGQGGQPALLLISFDMTRSQHPDNAQPVAGQPDAEERLEEMTRHLAYTRASLQATIDEQQASHEDTKSINEELQTTNEELETSREELQSINEELTTVNHELQNKIEQLSHMQNDMKNLLDNIEVGTIFLDENLRIRLFSREAALLYHLALPDLGRALGDIKSRIEGEDLICEAQHVLNTLNNYESKVQTADGKLFLARIQPYRTLSNSIGGVVLTFTDITRHMFLENAAKAAHTLAESVVDTIQDPMLVLTPDLTVKLASRAFYRFFKVQPADTLGRKIYELGDAQWDIPVLRETLENILPDRQTLESFETKLDFPAIGQCRLTLNARRVVDQDDKAQLILLMMSPDPANPGEDCFNE